jgi:monoamine oxidase
VVTIPPRLVIETVGFSPPLNDSIQKWMTATPTWMAGNAKFVAIYEEPFWRADGLSGDAISRRGPLLEIHDASPSSTREGALFGFVGTPADQRHGKSSEIIDSAIRQLTALFGPKAARTKNILFEDWRKRPLPPFHRINLRHSSIRFMAPCHTRMRPGMGGCSLLRPRPLRNSVGFLKGALVTAEQAALDVIASQP